MFKNSRLQSEDSKSYKHMMIIFLLSVAGGIFSSLPINIFLKIAFLLLGGFCLIFLFKPLAGMMTFLVLRPILDYYSYYKFNVIPGIPIVGLFAILIVVSLLLFAITNRDFTLSIPNIKPLLLMLIISIPSFITTEDRFLFITYYLRMLSWISIYIFVYQLVRKEEDVKKILFSIILSSLSLILIGSYQYFELGFTRVAALYGQPNDTAIYFSFVLFGAIGFILQFPQDKRKKFVTGMAVILFVMILLTFHRASWIGLLMGFPVIVYFQKRLLKYIIVIVLFAVLPLSHKIGKWVTEPSRKPKYGSNSLESRFILWKLCLESIGKHPLIGSGFGSSRKIYKKAFKQPNPPHNDYLRIAVEMGIFGAIAYICFLFLELRYHLSIVKNWPELTINISMLGMVTYFMVVSIAQNTFGGVVGMGAFCSLLAITKKFNLITGTMQTSKLSETPTVLLSNFNI